MAAWNGDPTSCIVNSSRGIIYADDAAAEARRVRDRMRLVLAEVR